VSEARSINRAEILTARTDAAAEAAEVAAAEAAAAEASAAVGAAAAGAAAKAAADTLCARAALAPELPKGGGAGGMAEDAEEIPGRACVLWGGEPRGIENSRRVAQKRGRKCGGPSREIDTD
jgi:hypothetical protein